MRNPFKAVKLKQNLLPDALAAQTVKEAECYKNWATLHPLYAPWLTEPKFQKLYEIIQTHTLVSPDRCYLLQQFATYARLLNAPFAECGVYKGGTAFLLAEVLKESSSKLYLFDSFEGLPKANPAHDNYYQEGNFSEPLETAQKLLEPFQRQTIFKKGWMPQTFSGLENLVFAMVHVDIDFYQSALDCCHFFYPRLLKGGVMIFDDYGFPACRGEKDAVDEFFIDKPESPIPLPSGQALILKS